MMLVNWFFDWQFSKLTTTTNCPTHTHTHVHTYVDKYDSVLVEAFIFMAARVKAQQKQLASFKAPLAVCAAIRLSG